MLKKIIRPLPPLLIAFCLLFFFVSCSSSRKAYTGPRYNFEIRFGSTGGFTNINPGFIVKSNGELSKQATPTAAIEPLRKLSLAETDSIYVLLDRADFNKLRINQVSNFTQYIEVKSENINNKICWFKPTQLTSEVNALHNFLLNLIKN
jgi:hypothetical protein